MKIVTSLLAVMQQLKLQLVPLKTDTDWQEQRMSVTIEQVDMVARFRRTSEKLDLQRLAGAGHGTYDLELLCGFEASATAETASRSGIFYSTPAAHWNIAFGRWAIASQGFEMACPGS
jgi:hypothetical protein